VGEGFVVTWSLLAIKVRVAGHVNVKRVLFPVSKHVWRVFDSRSLLGPPKCQPQLLHGQSAVHWVFFFFFFFFRVLTIFSLRVLIPTFMEFRRKQHLGVGNKVPVWVTELSDDCRSAAVHVVCQLLSFIFWSPRIFIESFVA
jgi:hypothetical protein